MKDDLFDHDTKGEILPLSNLNCIIQVFKEFKDALNNKLLNKLSHVREVHHKIELVPRMELQNKAIYWLN